MQAEIAERSTAAARQIAANTPAEASAIRDLATAIAEGDNLLESRIELRGLVIERAEELKEDQPQQAANLKALADELVDDAERYEPVEIQGIVEYLLARSQEFEYAERPEGIDAGTLEEQIERGKLAFEFRGCLACHEHEDFPEATATQGPNLSRIGDKLAMTDSEEANGADWLYTWLLNPSNYHVRTKMPDLFLQPITDEVDGASVTTDPAADIAAYLMSDVTGWEPAAATLAQVSPETGALTVDSEALNDLTLENLSAAFYYEKAEEYLETGIPAAEGALLKGAEVELILQEGVDELTDQQKLIYIGRRSIMKYGCSGCHDIPGFEDAKPIGTSLADWGRKDPSRLAFEHVIEYVEHGHGGHMAGHGGDEHGQADHATAREPLPEFYLMHLESHDRIGFIFQKLREPRRLRLPQESQPRLQRAAADA